MLVLCVMLAVWRTKLFKASSVCEDGLMYVGSEGWNAVCGIESSVVMGLELELVFGIGARYMVL
jgi:hypothetical protein